MKIIFTIVIKKPDCKIKIVLFGDYDECVMTEEVKEWLM